MKKNWKKIQGFIAILRQSRDEELDCGQCFSRMDVYAERELGISKDVEALSKQEVKMVAHHLALCRDCNEEYANLLRNLRTQRDSLQTFKSQS